MMSCSCTITFTAVCAGVIIITSVDSFYCIYLVCRKMAEINLYDENLDGDKENKKF